MPETPEPFLIRPYRPADRQALRDICVATCWMGEYRPEYIPDEWMWAEFWTRFFTDDQPQFSWVVEQAGGKVVGYLNGTPDQRQHDHYFPHLLPGIVRQVIRKHMITRSAPRKALWAMLRSMLAGELRVPKEVAQKYPATWHFNLLPEARGGGMGRRLFETFLESMKSQGVPGIHSQPLSVNQTVDRFLVKAGFEMKASWPIRAYRHVLNQPIYLQTWVKPL